MTENVPSIFPIYPYLPFGYKPQLIKDIEYWNVVIFTDTADTLHLVGELSFKEFKRIINFKKLEKYDYKNVLLTLDQDKFSKVFNYCIRNAKKILIKYLNKIKKIRVLQVEFLKYFYDDNEEICYIFKYRCNLFSKWYLAIVFNFKCFTQMDEYSADKVLEVANKLLATLKEI